MSALGERMRGMKMDLEVAKETSDWELVDLIFQSLKELVWDLHRQLVAEKKKNNE